MAIIAGLREKAIVTLSKILIIKYLITININAMDQLSPINLNGLFGKQYLHLDTLDDYINWAEQLMLDGIENNSIYYLASLSLDRNPERWDVEETFKQCLIELDLTVPKKDVAIQNYLEYLAKNIISKNIQPKYGVKLFEQAWISSEYSQPLLWIWGYLEEDLSYLQDYNSTIFNSTLNKKNIEEFIVSTAKQFLVLLQLEIPADFNLMCYCSNCSFIGLTKTVNDKKHFIPEWLYKKIYSRGYLKKHICKKCSSESLFTMTDKIGRDYYLKQKIKPTKRH